MASAISGAWTMHHGNERKIPTAAQIALKAAQYAFGGPLVLNNLCSIGVETIVSCVLPSGWEWCAQDWAGYDFEHSDHTRLEVKQSAARQTWTKQSDAEQTSTSQRPASPEPASTSRKSEPASLIRHARREANAQGDQLVHRHRWLGFWV
jgi:hypothetical protein